MARPCIVPWSIGLGLWVCLASSVSPLAACELKDPVRLDASVTRLTEHGDVLLSDGRLAKLSGIRMLLPEQGQPDAMATALEHLVSTWRDKAIIAAERDAMPDRWARQAVTVARESGNSDAHFALSLVRHGFAMAWPAELPPNCRNLYLQAEDAARRTNLGRWTQMQHKALDAGDGLAVAARAGQIAILSGRINHIGQTRRAMYFNFGARGVGASAELGLSTWRVLERQGWTRESLRGKIVRVRGVVSDGRPARLVLGDMSALEFLN